jgi:hypothetical protein
MMNKKSYWKIRKKLLKFIFKSKVLLYKGFNSKEKSMEYNSFKSIVAKKTIFGMIKGIMFVAILLYIDKIFLKTNLIKKFDNISIIVDVIIGGIGVAGVILGLYYANVSAIYTSCYANAPEKVSKAFQDDRLTCKCINSIIEYIIFSIVIIIVLLLNYTVSLFTILSFILWSVIVIISYSLAGNRTYQLANIYGVGDDSFSVLRRMVSDYLKQELFLSDPSFQNHFFEICMGQLEVRKEIYRFGEQRQDKKNDSLIQFMIQNLVLLEEYWKNKGNISRDSLWFRNEEKYQKWHLTSDTETLMALKTGTSLRRKSEHNYWWFEDELFSMNRLGVNYLISNGDYSSLHRYLLYFNGICKSAISCKEANYYVGQADYLRNLIGNISLPEEMKDNEKKCFAGVVEVISLLYLQFILETTKRYKEYKIENTISNVIREIDSGKKVNRCRAIRASEYKDFYEKIIMEVNVERKRITPDWLICQNVAKEEYVYLCSLVDVVREGIDHTFEMGRRFADKGLVFEACIIAVRFYEYESKLTRFIETIEMIEKELRGFQVDTALIWNECRISKLKETILKWKNLIPTVLYDSSCNFAIETWENREEYPDFLGESYNHVCEDAIEAIIQNNLEQFATDFDNLSKLTLLYQEYIRTDALKKQDLYRDEIIYYMFTSPLVEWAQIGGLAILWGEFKSDKQWYDAVKRGIDGIFSKEEDISLVEKLIEYIKHRDKFMIGRGYRDILETGWNQRVANAMRDTVVRESENNEIGYELFGMRMKTESKLLNTFCKDVLEFGFVYNPSEVFWVLCINPMLTADKRFHSKNAWEDRLNE